MGIHRFQSAIALAIIGFGLAAAPAKATFHLWRIDEIYSNASGTVQYIEFQQASFIFDDERFLTEAVSIKDTTLGNTFTFATDLPSAPTANSHFLVATPGYAALPGVPAPDYLLPSNNFFDTSADTISYAFGLDTLSFAAGGLPTDGALSLNRAYGATATTTAANSPTNFAAVTGTVPEPASMSVVSIALAGLALRRRRAV